MLARDGSITQLAPFNIKTWHAGISHWDGLSGLNSHSIGMEMDNAGKLTRVGATYRAWFQKEYPEDEVIHYPIFAPGSWAAKKITMTSTR